VVAMCHFFEHKKNSFFSHNVFFWKMHRINMIIGTETHCLFREVRNYILWASYVGYFSLIFRIMTWCSSYDKKPLNMSFLNDIQITIISTLSVSVCRNTIMPTFATNSYFRETKNVNFRIIYPRCFIKLVYTIQYTVVHNLKVLVL